MVLYIIIVSNLSILCNKPVSFSGVVWLPQTVIRNEELKIMVVDGCYY